MDINHSYAEIISKNGTRWLLDLNFLLSNYECIWGKGCKGIHHETSKVQGCCSNGVPLVGSQEIRRVKKYIKRLTPETWQEHGKHRFKMSWRDGCIQTRRRTDEHNRTACIFYNYEGFEGGEGCAFHISALKAGEDHKEWKPSSCVLVPYNIAFDEYENTGVLSNIVGNDGEGSRGFHDLDWWCMNSEEAFVGETPTYISMEDDLKFNVDKYDEEGWGAIREFLDLAYAKLGGKFFGTPVQITMPVKEN